MPVAGSADQGLADHRQAVDRGLKSYKQILAEQEAALKETAAGVKADHEAAVSDIGDADEKLAEHREMVEDGLSAYERRMQEMMGNYDTARKKVDGGSSK